MIPMITQAIKTKLFHEGDDLFTFIINYIKRLPESSIIVITSKIVALAENRTVPVTTERAKIKLIKQESTWALHTPYAWLTIKDGTVMATAGIDESNGNGKLILLPRDSFKTAVTLRNQLRRHYKLHKLGVIITDSRLFPLRAGTVGVALGYAGCRGRKNYKGKRDLFGRSFKHQNVDVADSLATAAVLTMGEGRERCPLAVIKEAPIAFTNQTPNRRELWINPKNDLYAPLFRRLR